MFLSYFSSVPSPVLFFGCFLVALTFIGAFAIRLLGFDEESEYYEEIGPDGKVRVAFQFPPHESKEERRKRWARALRRRFWPGLAPCPSCPQQAKTDEEVDQFLAALCAAVSGAPAQASRPHVPWDSFDPEVDVMLYDEKPKVSMPAHIPAKDVHKMRKKIFNVVMNAGPPKSLPPITEEDLSAMESQAEDLESGSLQASRLLVGRSPLHPKMSATWQAASKSRRTRELSSESCSDVDSETIMTVGNMAATRSILWAVLRKLEGMAAASEAA